MYDMLKGKAELKDMKNELAIKMGYSRNQNRCFGDMINLEPLRISNDSLLVHN